MFSSFTRENCASLLRQWDNFQNGLKVDGVRPVIHESWKRCRRLGTSPDAPIPRAMSAREFAKILEREGALIEVASPILERVYESVKYFPCFLNLANAAGICLKTWTGKDCVFTVNPGMEISERTIGTAGMPLAIKERAPLIVYGPEHYCRKNHEMVCVSSPVLDEGGILLGGITISCHMDLFHPWSFTFLREAATSVSEQLRLRRSLALTKLLSDSHPEGMIIVERNGIVSGLNARAGAMLSGNGELPGRRLQDVFPSVDWEECLAGQKGFAHREIVVEASGGKKREDAKSRLLLSCAPTGLGAVITLKNQPEMYSYAAKIAGINAIYTFEDIKHRSAAMRSTVDLAKRYAESDAPVLILGESGTGKELFAQAIHNAGRRRGEPFVAVNCGALPRELVQSELFGYSEGAFTGARRQGNPGKFELAHNGTIFLDEIGEMAPEAQASLLRLLQNGEVARIGGTGTRKVNVRVIAATNRDLRKAIAEHSFREDLFHRLYVFPLRIPPLRERMEDIELLARFFIEQFAPGADVGALLNDHVLERLKAGAWRGNVRELEHAMERLILSGSFAGPETAGAGSPDETFTGHGERSRLIQLLQTCNGNVAQVAAICGVGKSTLYGRLAMHGINPKNYRTILFNQQGSCRASLPEEGGPSPG